MPDYQLTASLPGQEPQTVQRLSDGAFIPFDPANPDYQEYLAWVAEGNVADPPPPLSQQQEVAAHLAGGLTITSTKARDGTSSDALDGTYGVTGADATNLNAILTVWNSSGTFPNGEPTVTIFDVDDVAHVFDAGNFNAFASAVSDFVHNSNLYGKGQADSLPPSTAAFVPSAVGTKGVTDGSDVATGIVGEYIAQQRHRLQPGRGHADGNRADHTIAWVLGHLGRLRIHGCWVPRGSRHRSNRGPWRRASAPARRRVAVRRRSDP